MAVIKNPPTIFPHSTYFLPTEGGSVILECQEYFNISEASILYTNANEPTVEIISPHKIKVTAAATTQEVFATISLSIFTSEGVYTSPDVRQLGTQQPFLVEDFNSTPGNKTVYCNFITTVTDLEFSGSGTIDYENNLITITREEYSDDLLTTTISSPSLGKSSNISYFLYEATNTSNFPPELPLFGDGIEGYITSDNWFLEKTLQSDKFTLTFDRVEGEDKNLRYYYKFIYSANKTGDVISDVQQLTYNDGGVSFSLETPYTQEGRTLVNLGVQYNTSYYIGNPPEYTLTGDINDIVSSIEEGYIKLKGSCDYDYKTLLYDFGEIKIRFIQEYAYWYPWMYFSALPSYSSLTNTEGNWYYSSDNGITWEKAPLVVVYTTPGYIYKYIPTDSKIEFPYKPPEVYTSHKWDGGSSSNYGISYNEPCTNIVIDKDLPLGVLEGNTNKFGITEDTVCLGDTTLSNDFYWIRYYQIDSYQMNGKTYWELRIDTVSGDTPLRKTNYAYPTKTICTWTDTSQHTIVTDSKTNTFTNDNSNLLLEEGFYGVNYKWTPNTTDETRVANVVVNGIKMTLKQLPLGFSITPEHPLYDYKGGDKTASVSISEGVTVKVIMQPSFVSNVRLEENTFSFTLAENEHLEERVGVITFKLIYPDSSYSTYDWKITQEGGYIEFLQEVYTDATQKEVNLYLRKADFITPNDITVECPNWITPIITEDAFKVEISENTALDRRYATCPVTVTVNGEALTTKNLFIYQYSSMRDPIYYEKWVPIGTELTYTEITDAEYINYTIEIKDSSDTVIKIYTGRAYKEPDNTINVLLNDIIKDYLSSYPEKNRYRVSATINTDSGNTVTYYFINSWEREPAIIPADSLYDTKWYRANLSAPIDNQFDPRQYLVFSWNEFADSPYFRIGDKKTVLTTNTPPLYVYGEKIITDKPVVFGCLNDSEFTYNIGCGDFAIYYINAFGGWDSLLVRAVRSDNIQSYSSVKSGNLEKNCYLNVITPTWRVNTDYGINNDNLYHLIESPTVYLHNLNTGNIQKVLVTDTTCEFKNRFSNATFTLEACLNNYRQ